MPVQLKAGWNDFVYIGATADVRDALSSIAGKSLRGLWCPTARK